MPIMTLITFVPSTFLSVVAAKSRVEWLKFSTLDTAIVGLCTLTMIMMMIMMIMIFWALMIIIDYDDNVRVDDDDLDDGGDMKYLIHR